MPNLFGFFDDIFLKISNFPDKNEPDPELYRILPLIGYFMIIMTIFDFIYVMFPLNLKNPEWELSVIGSFSDQSWGLLIGIGFVLTGFFGNALGQVWLIEIRLLVLIRWGLLLLGIVYLLALPLVFSNTGRLVSQIETEFTQRVERQEQLISEVKANLSEISNKDQLLQLAQAIGISIPNVDSLTPAEIQQEIQQQLPKISQEIPERAKQEQDNRTKLIVKRSTKAGFQLTILAIINIWVWYKMRKLGQFLL